MNLQSILDPIAVVIVWTFENILEVLGNIPNFLFIVVGFVGLFYWLKTQGNYNKKAATTGERK
ncbi:MAG: hypothetical protein V4616_00555 [Bacteroidota bacterium]